MSSSLTEMLKRIRFQIFERHERGELDYERDMATLRKHLQIAREMQNQKLVGQTYNALGYIENDLGYFRQAESHFQAGFGAVRDDPEYELKGAIRNNLGETYRRLGKYAEAIATYTEAKDLAGQSDNSQGVIIASNNLGWVHLLLGEYEQAAQLFQDVLTLVGDNTWEAVTTLIYTSCGLAEVELHHTHNVEAAWKYSSRAEDLALGRDYKLALGSTYLVKAHIAERDPNMSDEQPRNYYQMARDHLKTYATPTVLARYLVDEARYQATYGNATLARQFADEAKTIFHERDMVEDIELVDSILDKLDQ